MNQLRTWLLFGSALLCSSAALAGYDPTTLPRKASILEMQSLGPSAGVSYNALVVTGVQGAGSVFNWIAGAIPASCSALTGECDGGTTWLGKNSAGGWRSDGYWLRQGVQGEMHSDWFSGADVGAKLNAAFAALPVDGGTIVLDPNQTPSCYNFSTPVIWTTKGKYVTLKAGTPSGSTTAQGLCLNFTPTSGAAFTLDYADWTVNPSPAASGWDGIRLVNNGCEASGGCSGAAVGIQIGNTNGGDYAAHYQYTSIQGFHIGYQSSSIHNPNQEFIDSTWLDNEIAFETQSDPTIFIGGLFAGNGKVYVEQAIVPAPELYFTDTTFFSNRNWPEFDFNAGILPAALHFTDVHYECDETQECKVVQGFTNFFISNGSWTSANVTGTGDWFADLTGDGTYMIMYGTYLSASRPTTAILRLDGVSRALLQPALANTNFAAATSGAHAPNVTYMPLGLPSNPQPTWAVEGLVNFVSGVSVLSAVFANVALVYPCTTLAEKGVIVTITDAAAPAYHSTFTAGGGSTTTLARCTGTGGIWEAL